MDQSSNEISEKILTELQKHSNILDKHTSILDKHTSILNKHTAILDQHTSILNEHTRELRLTRKDIDTLDKTVNKWIFSEMDRLETKLTIRIEELEKKVI